MRLVYVLKECSREIAKAEHVFDPFYGWQKPKETWQEWQLEARLPDTGGEDVLERIKTKHDGRLKIKSVPGAALGWPVEYNQDAPIKVRSGSYLFGRGGFGIKPEDF